ncbi:uncharacterized protein LOC130748358 isoform X2 [Lotus japonicus]|uniref:uncharacterized protein LOC130748358 isoform X2 n=1 Tax=Lotus japonicus TaxID=34305 RepID=UPI00258AA23A|nr:uncharacterized protein LOC130748358 isoform X2 [Lotus japonicus]
MGKASLLVSLAKPPNKAMMGFDTKVSPNRLASRISVSGLGAPFWKDVVVGLKKDSHASLGAVGDVVGRPSFDRDFATVPWMLDLEGFSVVGDRGELGLSILDDVFFLEAFDSILEGGPTLVVRGRDAFLFPEIGCPSGVVEDIEDFDASSPVISPSKAICELVVDSLQVVSVFSSSINQLGIRGSYEFGSFHPSVAGDGLGSLPPRLGCLVLSEDGGVAQHQLVDLAVGLDASSSDVFVPDVLLRRRGHPKNVKRCCKPRQVPPTIGVDSVVVDVGGPSSSAIMPLVNQSYANHLEVSKADAMRSLPTPPLRSSCSRRNGLIRGRRNVRARN